MLRLGVANRRVRFRQRDYCRWRPRTPTLDAAEVIRRFPLHMLPRGFQSLLYNGLLAGTHCQHAPHA